MSLRAPEPPPPKSAKNRTASQARVAVCLLGQPRTFLRPHQQQNFGSFLREVRRSAALVELFAVFEDSFDDSIKGGLYRPDRIVHSRVMRERWKATSVQREI